MASGGERGKEAKSKEASDPASRERSVDAARSAFALKMAALHDLSLDLSLAEDADDLCRRAVSVGRGILGFDRIGIWFADPEDPALLYGSFGTDEAGGIRDERDARYRRSDEALPPDFYAGKDPVYYMGEGPCFNERHEVVGSAEKALALIWDGRSVIGEVAVDNLLSQRAIDGGSLELLVRFARIVGYLTSFKRVQSELRLLSEPDALTGIANRSTVLLVLEKQMSLAARKKERLSVIYCDMDGLKGVNEVLGRAVGDDYVRAACSMLATAVRDCDTVGRLGSDDFLVVLPDCDAAGAALIDARLGEAVAEANGDPELKPYRVSLSRGIANSGELGAIGPKWSAQALVELAKTRMLGAKPGA
jgi:diguanylate cyclase (GGDEF)-like protein